MKENNNLSKGEIRQEFLDKIAKLLVERNDCVNLALSGIVPILFDKVQKFLSENETPGFFLELLRDSDDINEDNTHPATLIEQTQNESDTQKLLSMILPDQIDNLAGVVTTVSGVSTSSGKTLVFVGASLLFSVLRNYLRQMRIQSPSLKDWMTDISYDADVMLPEPFKNYFADQHKPETPSQPTSTHHEKQKRSHRWLWWLLLACLLLLVLLLKGCFSNQPVEQTAIQKTTANMRELWGDLGTYFNKVLPDGTTLKIPQEDVEKKLIEYMESNNNDKGTENFTFDRLLFKKNSSELDAASKEQLNNIVEIIKAYPQINLTLEGYTDTTGSDEFNNKLSQDRADSVRQVMTELGANGDRIKAIGYGSANPVATNDTESNRAKNRRIELKVSRD